VVDSLAASLILQSYLDAFSKEKRSPDTEVEKGS